MPCIAYSFIRKENGTIAFSVNFGKFFKRLYFENSCERSRLYFEYELIVCLNSYFMQSSRLKEFCEKAVLENLTMAGVAMDNF